MPFDDPSIRTVLAKVKTGVYQMPECRSEPIKDLISHILVVDVHQRYTIEQIKAHPAFTMHLPLGYQLPTPLPAPNITQTIDSTDKKFFALLKNIGFESDQQIIDELHAPYSTTAKLFYYMYTEKRTIKTLPWDEKVPQASPVLEPFMISSDEIGLPASVFAQLGSPTSPHGISSSSSLYSSFKESAKWVLPTSDTNEEEDDDGLVKNYLFDPYIVKQMELVAEFQAELGDHGFNYFFPNDITLIVHKNEQNSYYTIQITQNSPTESTVSIDQVYGSDTEFEDFISLCEIILSKYEKKTTATT